jgi:hypothetical protein
MDPIINFLLNIILTTYIPNFGFQNLKTMKKIYTILLIFSPALLSAQTITQADLPDVGDAWTSGIDTLSSGPVPPGGMGQNWNFSGLMTSYMDTTAFMAPASTPYAA